ncbi:hypothetical protein RCO28_36455 [Streptomyces sp. LHD-70]|uniref:hypothetical protein n=1 Tax=Streptomyces sp. LHD-70 TaxID=3072140 RepID=UPI00280E675F|nr:hypothetical protein [Streptomyces sp. LHD-70]MDQ8707919.1 hypothetical protein [Streptomyces sp. LHD-70]
MPDLHARLLADVLSIGAPYPLVLTGGYAIFRKSVDQRDADEQVVNVRRASLDRKIKEVREGLPLQPDEETQASLWAMQQYARALRERGAAAPGEHPEALAYLHDRPGPDA